MNLLDIRTQFVKISGRYDLVQDDENFADNGANFYINAGANLLDKLGIAREGISTLSIPITANVCSVNFGRRCLSVKELWVTNSEARTQMYKSSLNALMHYFSMPSSGVSATRPMTYALASLDILNAAARDNLGSFLNLSMSTVDYRGAILAPPADGSYIVDVLGFFLQPELIEDEDENYWTLNTPEMLIKSALQQLYVISGRTADALAMQSALTIETVLQDKCNVEEEISDVTVMEG